MEKLPSTDGRKSAEKRPFVQIRKADSLLLVIALSVFVVGFLDYITGYEFGFFVFYFLPVALAAWTVSRTRSYLISILSAIVWFLADMYSSHPYSSVFFAFWNTLIRLLSFLLLAYAASKIRSLLMKERETTKALRDALSQIKTLRGLIPICASCKKIRDDKGYWNILESYIQEHSEAEFSHGICPDCMEKLYGAGSKKGSHSKKK